VQDHKAMLINSLKGTFVQYGFSGSSIARLASAAGLGKASLYHHFPGGKSEIAEVLIRRSVEQLQSQVFIARPKKTEPARHLIATVDAFVDYVDEGRSHCLLALFAQEQAPVIDRGALTELFDRWRQLLAESHAAHGYKPKAAQRAATALLNQLYGALVLARALGEPKLLLQAAKRCKNDIA